MKFYKLFIFLSISIILLGSVLVANQIYMKEKIEFLEKTEQRKQEEMNSKLNYEESMLKKELFELELRRKELFSECMKMPYISSNLEKSFDNLSRKYANKDFSFMYFDIKNEFLYSFQENKIYYGASLIKLLESLYLINYAMAGDISLDDTLVYKKEHISDYSLGLENHSLGESISLKTLISYMLSFSDNAAHEMIFEYIGIDALQSYASFLNVTLSITSNEHFGNLTALSGMNILKETYRVLSLHNSYSELLSSSMNNSYYNFLNFEETTFLHKYGFTSPYYNELGIYNSTYPYLISLFTNLPSLEYQTFIPEFSKEVFSIYQSNLKEKEDYCNSVKNSV